MDPLWSFKVDAHTDIFERNLIILEIKKAILINIYGSEPAENRIIDSRLDPVLAVD